MIKVDLHLHTSCSYDSVLPPRRLVELALRNDFDVIAVTDHDTILGALRTRDAAKGRIPVIVGSEVKSTGGDIIGLFLTQEINSREPLDVINEIESQGGIAVLPHPLQGHRNLPKECLGRFSAYEAINGRSGLFSPETASGYGLPWGKLSGATALGGSDTHLANDFGRVWSLMDAEPTEEAVRDALSAGRSQAMGKVGPRRNFLISQGIKAIKTRDVGLMFRGVRRVLAGRLR
ncbi:PHP domain-containing protein [Gemmatimonas phototrophica]|uniref:PHP domain-containing protein n=1 Tax=Gemmatimonas phototrophica TaxID=1379270 RepID=UPI0006A6D147